ncbi:glycerol-3-phosphate 1-O-acyltransferase PlsY [Marivita sp. S0852]|uniref:glycerol-3-phosphate 1-O-acyltransferase PlsY n=1 Tax=Marivita sp. S0852 TaxID=3373893 RepID=UPI0039822CE2
MPFLESSLPVLALWAIIGYLLGSIPFGLLLTKAFGLGNLREIGSGNIGATNVLRTGSKSTAAATLLLDGAKGAVAVLAARELANEDAAQLAALMAFLGHCYPAWLGFKGGKGVATFLGLMLALSWPIGLLSCATWLAAAAISRISSLSALVAAAWALMWCLMLGQGQIFVLTVILVALIIWRHKDNISRLKAGTEPRIGGSKT